MQHDRTISAAPSWSSAAATARPPGRLPARRGRAGPTPTDAYGLTLVPPAEGIARLAETITILKSMWTQEVFDFHGRYYTLKGNRNEPKPIQRPGPPLLVGGWGTRTLRLAAEQADIWNIPGPRTTPWTTSPNAATSWTHTARPSAGTRRRSPAPCSTSSPTTTPPVTARQSWTSSPPA
ncbi:LLM class flavin-dependent oxidoreductase [Streptomyces sp. NPDC002928]|uniref:LLM class flavin-dependent oxidoreductase n=1 Tax=Streptomyces sp. NPDC002928 TaxID=3154440 RepID=UPI0033BA7C56